VIVLIRAVDRPPPGEPGHRCRGFGRSAQADAAADGDAQPLQERLERALKQNPSEFTPFLVMKSTGSSITAYGAYRARGRGVFRKKANFSHNEINNRS